MRDLIQVLATVEQWERAQWLARALAVPDDPAAPEPAVTEALRTLHDGVLVPGGLDDLRAGGEVTVETTRLRDLAAQL